MNNSKKEFSEKLISETGISTRSVNALKSHWLFMCGTDAHEKGRANGGVLFVCDLITLTKKDLLSVEGIGLTGVKEIEGVLAYNGLQLAG